MSKLSHLSDDGQLHMVDVSDKPTTARKAIAQAHLTMKPATLSLALAGDAKKGNIRAAAEIAGIMAAKRTAELIPLCHPVSIKKADVNIEPVEDGFSLRAVVATNGQTGVEMEALTAVTIAALTLYDMLKAADHTMTIRDVRLVEKTGGVNGDFSQDAT